MLARVHHDYSRAEYLSDAVVHVSGIALALIGGPILVTLAAFWLGDAKVVTGMGIYAATLVAMLSSSALYNMWTRPRWSDALRRLDQSAIYFKIAGTYTPFVMLSGAPGWAFLTTIWGIAVAGASIVIFARGRVRTLSIVLYLALGWAGLIWGATFLVELSVPAFALVLLGGSLYTAGVAFLLWERLPFHNTIWHVFVLVATMLLYSALLVELARRASETLTML